MKRQYVLKLQNYGDFLSTRFLGCRIKEIIDQIWNNSENIIIDAAGVRGMTNSFADECFGKLLKEKGVSEFKTKVKFRNLNPLTKKVLIFVLSNRKGES